MLKSYEAIYDHGRIHWLGETPNFKRVRVVLVADDADELADVQENDAGNFINSLRATPAGIGETHVEAIETRKKQILTTGLTANEQEANEIMADTFGAWGLHSAESVKLAIAAQRRQDWGDR